MCRYKTDNESHYLNNVHDFRVHHIFCKRHAAVARNFVITNLIILIIPTFPAFVKKKTRKMVISDIYALNYTHISRVCQEKFEKMTNFLHLLYRPKHSAAQDRALRTKEPFNRRPLFTVARGPVRREGLTSQTAPLSP